MKRKRNNFRRTLGYSMTMGGTALIAGASPSPMKESIQVVATKGSEYVIPMVAVTGAAAALKQLGKLKPQKRKRGYK